MRTGSKHTLETKLKMRGRKVSTECRKKISAILKARGIKPPSRAGTIPWNKDKTGLQIAWNKGIPMARHSRKKLRKSINTLYNQHPEIRKKIGDKIRSRWQDPVYRQKCEEAQRGERSILWKGGIANEPYSQDFSREYRTMIRQRDCYKCRLCGKYGTSVHHIDYDKKNSDQLNLITLCYRCHSKTNHNRETWQKRLTVAETK